MPWKVSWAVSVDGQDMTEAMQPYLVDITVTDKDGATSDTCSLTFDDTDAQIKLPKDGAKVKVRLQGVQVFEGVVDTVRSSGSRSGGRSIKVQAKGFDTRGKAKEPQLFHKDDATLGDFLSEAATEAGFEIEVDPELALIQRDYWLADGESFLHLGERIAREHNATFKLRGEKAVMKPRGKDLGLPVIIGTVGRQFTGNVISWEIAPFTGRDTFTKAKVRYFDRKAAEYKEEETEFGLDRDVPEATNLIRATVADQSQAKAVGEAQKGETERQGGEGSVELDLTVEAQAEGQFQLSGARPGVDGTYRIVTVTHSASRSGGSTTKLELKQPQGAAGKDNR